MGGNPSSQYFNGWVGEDHVQETWSVFSCANRNDAFRWQRWEKCNMCLGLIPTWMYKLFVSYTVLQQHCNFNKSAQWLSLQLFIFRSCGTFFAARASVWSCWASSLVPPALLLTTTFSLACWQPYQTSSFWTKTRQQVHFNRNPPEKDC